MHSSLGASIAYSHSEKGVGKPHEFTSSQNAVCSNMFFPLVGRLCSRGFYLRFDWANEILAACFTLRGHGGHIDFLWFYFCSWPTGFAFWCKSIFFDLLKRKLNESLSFFKYCDQIVKNKYMFIFFQACERAESSKSCNLIASMKSGRYFTILPAEGPIVYYVAGWGAGGGSVQVSNSLLGGQFWKCTKCEWDRNFNTQDWHFM